VCILYSTALSAGSAYRSQYIQHMYCSTTSVSPKGPKPKTQKAEKVSMNTDFGIRSLYIEVIVEHPASCPQQYN
jgi:hypothetical protein